jgi:hypothetical protein
MTPECAICDGPFDDGLVLQDRQTEEIHLLCKECVDRYNEAHPHKKLVCPECGSDCAGHAPKIH